MLALYKLRYVQSEPAIAAGSQTSTSSNTNCNLDQAYLCSKAEPSPRLLVRLQSIHACCEECSPVYSYTSLDRISALLGQLFFNVAHGSINAELFAQQICQARAVTQVDPLS